MSRYRLINVHLSWTSWIAIIWNDETFCSKWTDLIDSLNCNRNWLRNVLWWWWWLFFLPLFLLHCRHKIPLSNLFFTSTLLHRIHSIYFQLSIDACENYKFHASRERKKKKNLILIETMFTNTFYSVNTKCDRTTVTFRPTHWKWILQFDIYSDDDDEFAFNANRQLHAIFNSCLIAFRCDWMHFIYFFSGRSKKNAINFCWKFVLLLLPRSFIFCWSTRSWQLIKQRAQNSIEYHAARKMHTSNGMCNRSHNRCETILYAQFLSSSKSVFHWHFSFSSISNTNWNRCLSLAALLFSISQRKH